MTVTLPATADFETGTNGNVVDTTDPGSATAWTDDANYQTYSNTQVHAGSLSCYCPGSASGNFLTWILTTPLTDTYWRFYLYVPANPAALSLILRFTDSGGTRAAEVWVNTDGTLFIRDSTNGKSATTGVAITLNQWTRVEAHVVNNTTTGSMELKLFNTAESTTADSTVSFSAGNTRADVGRAQIGNISSVIAFYSDDYEWNNTGYPGPISTGQILLVSADSVDGAWTDQANGTSLAAAIDETTASDSDYIRSPLGAQTETTRVKLASGLDPLSSDGHIIHWRVRKDAAGGEQINMTVTLMQGGGNSLGGGTQIATFNRNNVDGTGWTTYDETLSSGEADSITDYADLYLEFTADTA